MFSPEAAPFCIPTSDAQRFQFLHILANTCCFVFLIIATLTGVKEYLTVVSICTLLKIFSYAHWPWVHLLWRNVYLPIFKLSFSLLFWIPISLNIHDLQIFYPVLQVVFSLVDYVLWWTKILIWQSPIYFTVFTFVVLYFAFVAYAFGVKFKKSLPNQMP